MIASRGYWQGLLAIAMTCAVAVSAGHGTPLDTGETAAPNEGVAAFAGLPPNATNPAMAVPPCASQPELLGLSRIVEIDTSSGPRFGDQYIGRGETLFLQDHEVILTFDDGPMRRYTQPILDALDQQCTRATFFAVGRMAIADPAMLKEVHKRGHTIATHTWSHKKLSSLSPDAAKYEIELGLSAVAKALGEPVAPFFRFPYLGDNKSGLAYVGGRKLGTFGIHVDSRDFRTRNPAIVLKQVMSQLARTKKGIILFHDIQPATAGALQSLLAALKAGGYKIVHMVAKTPAETLPEFDAIAERALKAKQVAAANAALADRAVTWPNSGVAPPGTVPPPGPKAPGDATTSSADVQKPQKRPAKAPAQPSFGGSDWWQLKTMGEGALR